MQKLRAASFIACVLCLTHAPAFAQDTASTKYVAERVLAVNGADLGPSLLPASLMGKLGIVLQLPVKVTLGPAAYVMMMKIGSAPEALNAQQSVFMVTRNLQEKKEGRVLNLQLAAGQCVPLQALTSAPLCSSPQPLIENVVITLDKSKEKPELQGMACSKTNNRDVIAKLYAPDQKCVRQIIIFDEKPLAE